MSTESDLIDYMLANSPITNVVGSRIFRAGSAKQNETLPYITLQRVGTAFHDASDGSTGLVNPLVQVDCYDDTPEEATTLAALVHALLKDVRPSTGIAGTSIRSVIPQGQLEDFDLPEDGSYAIVPRVIQTYSVWFN